MKAGGLTEAQHRRKEELKAFREAILASASYETDVMHGMDTPLDGQIQLASNGTGAWVDVKMWVDASAIDSEWLDDVANPPSADELLEALRALLKACPQSMSIQTLKPGMELVARAQGENSWVGAKL